MIKTLHLLAIGLLLLTTLAQAKGADPYQVIDKQAQAEEVLRSVQATMASQLNLRLTKPVQIHLVEATEMDKLVGDSPYQGAEIGLYTGVANGKHQVYVMRGWARDYCAGITAHELTHAWQQENTPRGQDQALVEGFAMWVEYKYYDSIGAYSFADRMRSTADPVYGVGFFAMMDLEKAVGPTKVADAVRKATTVKDLPKKTGLNFLQMDSIVWSLAERLEKSIFC